MFLYKLFTIYILSYINLFFYCFIFNIDYFVFINTYNSQYLFYYTFLILFFFIE